MRQTEAPRLSEHEHLYSWFSSDDFRRVQTLSDSELAGITIGATSPIVLGIAS